MAGTPQPRALGPDALDVSTDDLAGLLAGNTGRIKTVITDQKVIAGIGNAYSDEILHVAKISPFATAGKLSGAQLTCLHEAMASVLSDAVRRSVGQGAAMLKGVPGVKAAYAASKAGVRSLGESLRAEYAQRPIRVTVLEPGYIESEMTAKSASTMLMVDNATGVKALVAAIEREPGRAAVPWWPWAPLVRLMWVLPPRLTRRFA